MVISIIFVLVQAWLLGLGIEGLKLAQMSLLKDLLIRPILGCIQELIQSSNQLSHHSRLGQGL